MRSVTLCLLFIVATAAGQTDRSTLTGTVVDPNGALVADAAIEVRNADSGALFTGGTSSTGNYSVALPAGTYELTVVRMGFKTLVRPGIEVLVADTVRVDVQLEIGSVTEEITVTAETPLLKTEGGDISYNVDYTRANQLPVLTLGIAQAKFGNIRDPLQVLNLLPGTNFSQDNILRVNGLPSNTHAIRIEGQDATNGIFRQLNSITQAGVDAIEQVSIQTSNYAAEFGQVGGGYFNYTMRSGANKLHGGGFDYYVNEFMNAGVPFTDDGAGHHIKNRQRRNDYGFTLGGPIVLPHLYDGHDRTFFFFSFEQFREAKVIRSDVTTMPTAAFRQGDFSALLGSGTAGFDPLGRVIPAFGLYDPATQSAAPNGAAVRDLFPGNKIPVTDFDPVALKIQSYFPDPRGPNAAGLVNNYAIPAYQNYKHATIPSIKLDHVVNANIKLSGYYSQTRQQSPMNIGIPAPISPAVPLDSRSQTVRVNYDQTLTPTLLLHLGAGLLTTRYGQSVPSFDESSLGLVGYYANVFPGLRHLGDSIKGGYGISVGPPRSGNTVLWEYKPTANASLTWVKSNHTIKAGGELVVEGFPLDSRMSASGNYEFNSAETSFPAPLLFAGQASSGFPYASFLLGRAHSLSANPPTQSRLGNHALGLFLQDTWKATRKLTLAYGLRYDYITYLKEQYGRMENAAFHTPNPTIGGRDGAVIYEGYAPGRCQCHFASNYPLAFAPRLSAAYQIDSHTVLRGGFAISYAAGPSNAYLSYLAASVYQFDAPAYGDPAAILSQGNPYREGNPYGNGVLSWPNFDPGKYPVLSQGSLLPESPQVAIDRHAGRPPRIAQWNFGLQREVFRGLVVEASYIGNRSAWWAAPALGDMYYNALQPGLLRSYYGIDVTSQADQFLLNSPLSSPAAAAHGLQAPYAGFPAGQFVNQALRPYPQWQGLSSLLGPPVGNTWYDALQVQVTKRYSHGLDLQAAFTWQKELTNGLNSDASYYTSNQPLINDVFNRRSNKQISSQSQPFQFVLSFNYTTPKFAADGGPLKSLSWAVRDWTFGGVLRYQSGALLQSPPQAGLFNIKSLLLQSGLFGSGTYFNRVAGQPLFTPGFDPNSKFDPTQQTVLNPAAWVVPPSGTFGVSAPYYSNYRWQRQPSESLNLGRVFRLGADGRYLLQVRAEFQNVFNRMFYAAPYQIDPFAAAVLGLFQQRDAQGNLSSGYGVVSTASGGGSRPRTGQLVARFTF